MQNFSCGHKFGLQDNDEHASKTHFHMKGCAPLFTRTRFKTEAKDNSEMAYLTMAPIREMCGVTEP